MPAAPAAEAAPAPARRAARKRRGGVVVGAATADVPACRGAPSAPDAGCVACRTPRPKRELIRVVRRPDGTVGVDATGRQPGRGAYLCQDAACFDLAGRRRALATRWIRRSGGHRARADRGRAGWPRRPDHPRGPKRPAIRHPAPHDVGRSPWPELRGGTRGRRGPRKPQRRPGGFVPGSVAIY
ncbi:MAG: YlxR family protein [Chloroflexota bacterium]